MCSEQSLACNESPINLKDFAAVVLVLPINATQTQLTDLLMG